MRQDEGGGAAGRGRGSEGERVGPACPDTAAMRRGAGALKSCSPGWRPAGGGARAAWPLVLVLLATTMISSGCGPTYRPTGFLATYDGLAFVRYDSDLAWERLADAPPPDVVYLAPIIVRPGVFRATEAEMEEDVAEVLRGQTYVWLTRRYGGRLRSGSREPNLENLALAGRRAAELELAITEMRRGSGIVRWLVGFVIPWSATTLQVEGRLRALPGREPIAQFTCRVVHPGMSYFGLNPKSLSLRYCLVVSADWAARDLSELPSLLFERWAAEEEDVREMRRRGEPVTAPPPPPPSS